VSLLQEPFNVIPAKAGIQSFESSSIFWKPNPIETTTFKSSLILSQLFSHVHHPLANLRCLSTLFPAGLLDFCPFPAKKE
jgi:hypothetical protein